MRYRNIINLVLLLLFGCASRHEIEYSEKGFKFEELGLNCSKVEALTKASAGSIAQYPYVKGDLAAHPFSIFSTLITGGEETIIEYSLKAVFEYRLVEGTELFGRFFERSIEVILNKNCEVIEVEYNNGEHNRAT
jgi:hypothetical protein